MKKYVLFIFLLCSLCIVSSCLDMEGPIYTLVTIVNDSDESLIFDISEDYPDTLVSFAMEATRLLPHQKGDIDYYISKDKLFKKISILQIMVYNEEYYGLPIDTLRKYNNKYIIKRYQLSKHDLDSMNWTVVYP